VANRSYVGF